MASPTRPVAAALLATLAAAGAAAAAPRAAPELGGPPAYQTVGHEAGIRTTVLGLLPPVRWGVHGLHRDYQPGHPLAVRHGYPVLVDRYLIERTPYSAACHEAGGTIVYAGDTWFCR